MVVNLNNLLPDLLAFVWPMIRLSGLLMVMPAVASSFVPVQARVLIAVGVGLMITPLVETPDLGQFPNLEIALLIGRELLLGLTMGFALKLVLDAVLLGGQSIAMSMGLGFAVFIDRARGVNVPVLGQFFLVLGTLIFLALDGHLHAIELLVRSFQTIPIGSQSSSQPIVSELLAFSGIIFTGAVKIALPAVTALLVVNIAFGVMSRAAPTLNLFAVGFPVSLLFGVIAVMISLEGFSGTFAGLVQSALMLLSRIASGQVFL